MAELPLILIYRIINTVFIQKFRTLATSQTSEKKGFGRQFLEDGVAEGTCGVYGVTKSLNNAYPI